jgi:tape measure domain-containing protein
MPFDVAGLAVKVTPKGIRATTDQLKKLAAQAGKTEKAADKLEKETNATGQAMYEFGAKVQRVGVGPMQVLRGAMIGLPIAYLGKKFFDFGKSILTVGAQFEVMEAQLTAVMGSEGGAQRALKWIDEFTLKTPLQVEQVTESFNMLKAIGLDPMTGSLQAIVDATSFTAQGYEGLIGVTRQLGQAWAKDRLSGEEVMRLRERMIPVYDILAEKMGKTSKQIAVMSEKGQLARPEIQLLLEAMGEKYAGAAAIQMDTLTGKVSNFQQAITFAFREMASGGALEGAKHALDIFAEVLTEAIDTGRVDKFGKFIGKAFIAVALSVEAAFTTIPIAVKLSIKATMQAILAMVGRLEPLLLAVHASLSAIMETHTELMSRMSMAFPPAKLLTEMIEGFEGLGQQAPHLTAMSSALDAMQLAASGAAVEAEVMDQEIVDLTDDLADSVSMLLKHKKALDEMANAEKDAADAAEELGEEQEDVGEVITDSMQKVIDAFEKADLASARLSNTLTQAAFPTRQLGMGFENLYEPVEDVGDAMDELATTQEFTLIPAMGAVITMTNLETNAIANMKPKLTEAEKAVKKFSDEFQQSIVDIFGQGFRKLLEGEFDDLGDILDSFLIDIADTIVRAFIDQLISHKGSIKEALKSVFGTEEEEGLISPTMAILGGAGMILGGAQQGGAAGALSGMMGGAMAGFQLGTTVFPGIGSVVGTVVGAVVGGLIGLFGGGGKKTPWFESKWDPTRGFQVGREKYGGFTGEEQEVWERNMDRLLRETELAYKYLLRLFEMPELFDLVEALEGFDFGRTEMSPQEFAKWLQDVWIPEQMDTMFGQALRGGLEAYGMNLPSIEAVFAELGKMPGEERVQALETLIRAIKGARELLDTSFADLQARLEMDTMALFGEQMTDMFDAIQLLQTGWDDMSLFERARDLETIGQIFEQITDNTLMMLRQIQTMSESINRSFDRMREDITLEGKDPYEIAHYAMDQVQTLMEQLGQATSPEQVGQITAEIQRYLQMLRGSGVNLEATFGITDPTEWKEYILSTIDQAQALANERLQVMEDLVRQRYEETRDAFEAATAGVLEFAQVLQDFPWPGDGRPPWEDGGIPPWKFPERFPDAWIGGASDPQAFQAYAQAMIAAANNPPQVTVNVQGDIAALEPYIQTLIHTALRGQPEYG